MISQKIRKILQWLVVLILFVGLVYVLYLCATDGGVDPAEAQPYPMVSSTVVPTKLVDLRFNITGFANFDMQGVERAIVQVPFFTSNCYASRVYFGTQTYTCQAGNSKAIFTVTNLEPGLAVNFQAQPGVVTLQLEGGNNGLARSQIPQVSVTW